MAALAEVGMRHIERDLSPLVPPDKAELDRTYRILRQLHGSAYGWDPPDVPPTTHLREGVEAAKRALTSRWR